MKKIIFLFSILALASCHQDYSKISVRNNLSKAVIRNVEWGGVPLASSLFPGETSSTRKIYEDSYYDIKFPAQYPVKFYIDYNGDQVFVQTRAYFRVDAGDEIVIILTDTTRVFNPMIDNR